MREEKGILRPKCRHQRRHMSLPSYILTLLRLLLLLTRVARSLEVEIVHPLGGLKSTPTVSEAFKSD